MASVILTKDERMLCLADTGEMARRVCGYNYDIDENTGERIGDGGIYPTGPHQEMVEFLDDRENRYKQLMCPRGARKTSLLVAWFVRLIISRPNIRIFYAMQSMKKAKKTMRKVRDMLESAAVVENFGKQRGKPWSMEEFTVGTRTDEALRDPTMSAGGLDVSVTGDHPDIIALDDLCDWTNIQNPDQIEKQITYLKLCFPLLERNGILIDVGTPYDESDVHHHIRSEMPDKFKGLWIPCGLELADDGKGKVTLDDGEPAFPHQSREYLQGELDGMTPREWMANYALECSSPDKQLFFRDQFKTGKLEPWMQRLNGYILTDTAATTTDRLGSYSVVAIVLLSHDDVAYLADMHVGMWKPDDVVEEIVGMNARWRGKCRVMGTLMESISMNKVYRSAIERRAREMQLPLNMIPIPRGIGASSKAQRIASLQPRFRAGKFVVLDTVPLKFETFGVARVLFCKDGFTDKNHDKHPAGVMVDQFCRQNMKRKDIPDALADLEAVNRTTGDRICQPSPQPRWVESRVKAPSVPMWKRGDRRGAGWSDLARRTTR